MFVSMACLHLWTLRDGAIIRCDTIEHNNSYQSRRKLSLSLFRLCYSAISRVVSLALYSISSATIQYATRAVHLQAKSVVSVFDFFCRSGNTYKKKTRFLRLFPPQYLPWERAFFLFFFSPSKVIQVNEWMAEKKLKAGLLSRTNVC